MEVTVSGVHQTIFAYVASTMRFQVTSQIRFAVSARKSDADVLAVAHAKETKSASEMQTTQTRQEIGAISVLLRGLVRPVESVLLSRPACRRTQHVLIVYMMLRHIWLGTRYKPLISRRPMKKFMSNAWKIGCD